MYKRDYLFMMNVMKQVIQTRSCTEILTIAIDIKIDTTILLSTTQSLLIRIWRRREIHRHALECR